MFILEDKNIFIKEIDVNFDAFILNEILMLIINNFDFDKEIRKDLISLENKISKKYNLSYERN